MTNFTRAVSSYFTSTRHTTGIGEDARSISARRRSLLREGNIKQAAGLRRAVVEERYRKSGQES